MHYIILLKWSIAGKENEYINNWKYWIEKLSLSADGRNKTEMRPINWCNSQSGESANEIHTPKYSRRQVTPACLFMSFSAFKN